MPSNDIDVSCIGYSQTLFSTSKPDRLCRGREHWIYQPDDVEDEMLFRTVISGTTIKDSQVRFLERGLRCSGKHLKDILAILFPQRNVIAWVEEGDANEISPHAGGVELYQINRPHAPHNKWGARYELPVQPETWERALACGADVFLIDPMLRDEDEPQQEMRSYPPLVGEEPEPASLPESLRNALFLLVGHRNPQHPIARFQAIAIADVLKHCSAVVLIHQDKHDICLGVYTQDMEFEIPVASLIENLSVVVVPFSIPPMLARWDRALRDLQKRESIAVLASLFVDDEESESVSNEEE